jgi:hypothetical protein
MSRIDRILVSFDLLDREAKRLDLKVTSGGYSLKNLASFDGKDRAQMTRSFQDVIMAVYLEFNILLQRDSFFSTRLGTYVRMDYSLRARHEDFSQYTNALLITAGRNVLDRLQEYQKFNIAEAESDLSTANVINMTNLEQMENLSVSYMEDYLIDLNKRAGHSFAYVNDPSLLRTLIIGQKSTWYAVKQDQADNEAENVRAKVCIQTLAFQRYRHFINLCQGAVLKSTLIAQNGLKNMPLTVEYNKLYLERSNNDNLFNRYSNSSVLPASNRFSNVCALRDYYRNNLVAWLTRDTSSSH